MVPHSSLRLPPDVPGGFNATPILHLIQRHEETLRYSIGSKKLQGFVQWSYPLNNTASSRWLFSALTDILTPKETLTLAISQK